MVGTTEEKAALQWQCHLFISYVVERDGRNKVLWLPRQSESRLGQSDVSLLSLIFE